ncbi:LysR family transcriptional regulator [Pontivivens ytuae]|uniref:LysR family transcriptional regulator n=1 Tax=Pontivivens ytuae TaxID=2789856 RepID=A0A7S9LNC7_9RHOB|nr:LysR family transcriptional regulator [Pontivivens ytuae]QPH52264.1 LysR family transcriptional regulator [Pontivivens ytuae]
MASPKPNWDDLRVFLELSRHGTLLGAGRALGLDPATVARRVTALETKLAARLFDRSQRGYALTEAGRRLTGPAAAMEAAATGAADRVAGQSERLSGSVRIGAPEGVASFILAEACAALADAHPDLRVELVALPRVFSLSQREADIALALTPPTAGRLRVRRVADYDLHLYAAKTLAERHPVTTRDDLKAHRFIGYIADMIFDKELDYAPLIAPDLRPQLASTSLTIQLEWTVAGHGICVLPDFVAESRSDLVRLLPEEIAFTRSFHLIRHEDDLRTARITRAADALTEALRTRLA